MGPWGQDAGAYYRTIGQPGIAIPWSDEVTRMMLEKEDMFEIKLPGLWYSIEETSYQTRIHGFNYHIVAKKFFYATWRMVSFS